MHKIPIVLCVLLLAFRGKKNVSSLAPLWEREHLFALESKRSSPHGFPLKQISKQLVNKLSQRLSYSHDEEFNVHYNQFHHVIGCMIYILSGIDF